MMMVEPLYILSLCCVAVSTLMVTSVSCVERSA